MIEVIGLIVTVLLVINIRLALTAHRNRMDVLRLYREQFFERAQRVMQSDTLDDDALVQLKRMAQEI